jgi:hypothetical protein
MGPLVAKFAAGAGPKLHYYQSNPAAQLLPISPDPLPPHTRGIRGGETGYFSASRACSGCISACFVSFSLSRCRFHLYA